MMKTRPAALGLNVPVKEINPKHIWEIRITLPRTMIGAAEIIRSYLAALGFASHSLIKEISHGRRNIAFYCPSVHAARRAMGIVKASSLQKIHVRLKEVTPAACQKTQTLREPIAASRNFIIAPVEYRQRRSKTRKEVIFISSPMTFGTGLHETTRLMIQLIERCRGKFKTFIDIGTGSGILSIAAFKCGAQEITALDNDPACLPIARMNFQFNRLAAGRTVKTDIKKWTSRKSFDFVAANLFTDDLLDIQRRLSRYIRPGGFLAVSGISLDNFKRFYCAFSVPQMRCRKIIKGREWATVLYKRNG